MSSRTQIPAPSGRKRGCCTLCSGCISDVVGSSKRAWTRRARSHGMSGTFHACQTAPDEHGITAGSKQKSAPPSSRRVLERSWRSSDHTSAWSTTYTTRRPSTVAHGAWTTRSGPWSVSWCEADASSGCHHRFPSTAAYTTAAPSADQHQHPPPMPRPTRGWGAVVKRRTGDPSRGLTERNASRSWDTAKTMAVPSGDSRGSLSSRVPTHRATGIGARRSVDIRPTVLSDAARAGVCQGAHPGRHHPRRRLQATWILRTSAVPPSER